MLFTCSFKLAAFSCLEEAQPMRTEQPKVIHLKDYQVPDYLIDETHLTFELYEDRTLVHA